ncbi:hypothetical protein ACFOW1_16690 [Parasediminibacterium paludis]|uniref:Outer membrane protein beta-barrel domain-containing protein n=1 Tax=Parasediminibacterium paludis TaxID=908966 RepID=A0ABV8Q1M2_9BACT
MKTILLYIWLLLPFISLAQSDSTNTKSNHFIASINYQTRLHYFGRTDSIQSSGLLPSMSLESKLGIYATGNFIFVNNATTPTKYVGTTVEIGYQIPATTHFNGNVFYTQFIYNDKRLLVQSALKSQAGINTAFTNKIININIGGDLKFSDKTDYGATFGLDHLFLYKKGLKNMAFAFNPSVYVYAGTQNFSNTYQEQKRNLLGLPYTQQTTETVTNFNILSYEISMPIVFVCGKFNASITPSYVAPQNLILVANNPSQSERGTNLFYATFGIGCRL